MREQPQFPEELSLESFAERAKILGHFYSSVVKRVAGIVEEDPKVNPGFEPFEESILESVRSNAKRQEQLLQIMSARDVLEQRFNTPEQKQLLEDESVYRMVQVNPGIVVIYMPKPLFQSFFQGAQAVAVNIPQGVSFAIIPEHDDPGFMKKHIQENLPHELHHIVWRFLQSDKVVSYEEQDDVWESAYAMFQNELIARLCSDGPVGAYSGADESRKDILDVVGLLNTLLEEIEEMRLKTAVLKVDIIGAVIEARNFSGLQRNLLRMKEFIGQQPLLEVSQRPSNRSIDEIVIGWGGPNG